MTCASRWRAERARRARRRRGCRPFRRRSGPACGARRGCLSAPRRDRSSRTTTSWPRSIHRRAALQPMKPAPPVTRYFTPPSSSALRRSLVPGFLEASGSARDHDPSDHAALTRDEEESMTRHDEVSDTSSRGLLGTKLLISGRVPPVPRNHEVSGTPSAPRRGASSGPSSRQVVEAAEPGGARAPATWTPTSRPGPRRWESARRPSRRASRWTTERRRRRGGEEQLVVLAPRGGRPGALRRVRNGGDQRRRAREARRAARCSATPLGVGQVSRVLHQPVAQVDARGRDGHERLPEVEPSARDGADGRPPR